MFFILLVKKVLASANVSRKLDRVLTNDKWLSSLPLSSCEFLPHGVSDHSPMIVKSGIPFYLRKIFRVNQKHFLTAVASVWSLTKEYKANKLIHMDKQSYLTFSHIRYYYVSGD